MGKRRYIKRKTDVLREEPFLIDDYKEKIKDNDTIKEVEEKIFLEQLYYKVISKKTNNKKKEGFDSKELIKDIIFNNISVYEAKRKYNIDVKTYYYYIKLIRKCYIEFQDKES